MDNNIQDTSGNHLDKSTEQVATNYTSQNKSVSRTNPWGIFVLASTFLLIFIATYLFFYLDTDFANFREERIPFLLP